MANPGKADLQAFRAEARAWLEANLPASLRDDPDAVSASLVDGATPSPDILEWRRRVGAKGWGVPTWPSRYGGGGLSPAEAQVLKEEMTRLNARNPIGGLGVMMFGPTLLEYGDEAQLARHIPPIAKMELRWCQGFSEPGAGSDLASLSTSAIDRGDHYLVSGQKVWTTGGQYADWCFCLVRTDTSRKHEGISFLLINMRSPGVEVRPIVLISGEASFCEIFFTEVKVPKANLVGRLNGGWDIAKRLLQHERQNTIAGASPLGVAATARVDQHALARLGADAHGRLADSDLRSRITRNLMEAQAFELTFARALAEGRAGQGPGNTSSVLRNSASLVRQGRAELVLEIMGADGLAWSEEVRAWLRGKSASIAGGSAEIQNNIIAKRILGLPDPAVEKGKDR